MKKFLKKHKWFIIFTIFAICFCFVFNHILVWGNVESNSMSPTLEVGQITFSSRIFDADSLKVGDIIAFEHENQSGETKVFIKRIAAVAGDTVQIGEETVTLQEGEFYLLGDNTDNSWDSRYWEEPFIKAEDIKGVLIYPKAEKLNE